MSTPAETLLIGGIVLGIGIGIFLFVGMWVAYRTIGLDDTTDWSDEEEIRDLPPVVVQTNAELSRTISSSSGGVQK